MLKEWQQHLLFPARKKDQRLISCPDIIKMYNKGMAGSVDVIDQRAAICHLDRISTIRFYWCIFFHLIETPVLTAILFTIWCIQMMLHCSTLKPLLFEPTWLEDTQIEEEHHQMAKQVPKENTITSLRKVTYHHIFQSFKIFKDDVNIATKT